MANLSKYLVIGLILLNSTHVFAEDAAAVSVPLPELVEGSNPPPLQESGKDPQQINGAARELQAPSNPQEKDVMRHVDKEFSDLINSVEGYMKESKACRTRENRANTFCRESRSPEIKKYISVTQVIMAGVSGMMDACSKVGKMMDAGNKALTAYQAACSSARGLCMSSCSAARKHVQAGKTRTENLVSKASAYADAEAAKAAARNDSVTATGYQNAKANIQKEAKRLEAQFDEELSIKGDYLSVAEKEKTCDGYARELASAGVGLVGMLLSYQKANNCEDNTSNTALTTPTPVDCTIAENKQNNMTCICQDAPRTPGCSTGLDSTVAAKNAESMRAASTSDYTPTAGGKNSGLGLDGGSNGGMDLASKNGDGGSSAPGAPMGGGGAGLDGGGGFGGSADKASAQKAAGLNTNILGGEGGGGGGGGGWGRGGGSDDGLRQYLPGGAKDPAIGVAGQAAMSKEVTSQGGKSNWEKVRDRYRDNKPRLLEP